VTRLGEGAARCNSLQRQGGNPWFDDDVLLVEWQQEGLYLPPGGEEKGAWPPAVGWSDATH